RYGWRGACGGLGLGRLRGEFALRFRQGLRLDQQTLSFVAAPALAEAHDHGMSGAFRLDPAREQRISGGQELPAPRCGARSKRTGRPCQGAAMPNGRCKLHGGKSTGPRTPEGPERSRRANWKHGHFSREAKAERSRVRAAMRYLRDLI